MATPHRSQGMLSPDDVVPRAPWAPKAPGACAAAEFGSPV